MKARRSFLPLRSELDKGRHGVRDKAAVPLPVAVLCPFAGHTAHLRQGTPVFVKPTKRFDEVVLLAVADYAATRVIENVDRSRRIGSDCRQAASHRLEQHQPETFEIGGKDK